MSDTDRHILLTGGTGFLGKVVLEELVRRADELSIARIYLLIRPKRGGTPAHRFEQEVIPAECFRLLPDRWHSLCTVVGGNVTTPDLALSDEDRALLTERVTHIVNCAAAVDFDRPIAEASRSNIDGALNTLGFAGECRALRSMVHVSTAYVWPERLTDRPCDESLVPLPVDPQTVYDDILAGRADQEALLAQTGHANTYTLTKCLAEHLLFARRGSVPLHLVRPSIISACRVTPFPGWIDSHSGFSGFVALYGAGLLRVLAAEPTSKPDIVPCDEVAHRIVTTVLADDARPIVHAVAGLRRSVAVPDLVAASERYFTRYSLGARVGFRYVGPWGRRFATREWLHSSLPHAVAKHYYTLTRQAKKARQVRRVDALVRYANRGFRYFSHASFDFRGAEPGVVPDYDPMEYHATICEGISRHLSKSGARELPVAGRKTLERGSDLRFALGRARGNATIRLGAFLLRKVWRRCTDLVTYDAPSFERARAAAAPGDLVVIVPTHRSYFDFLVLPYLFFARPNLRIDVPHIAATEDFSRIPIVSTLLRQAQAFFIKRGVGAPDPDLTRRVAALAANGHTLKFFIEGTRSRSRRVLAPRRGLLRALQSTGKRCVILPVAVSYDRLPEETALARELTGERKKPHRLRDILRWIRSLSRGEVRLGRIHVRCGAPLRLDSSTDVRALSREIAAELQAATVVSTFHLRAFLSRVPLDGVDVVRLRRAIEHRGGVVVDSTLPLPAEIDDTLYECLLNQWRPIFFAELRHLAVWNPALRDHVEQHGWHSLKRTTPFELEPIPGLLEALFGEICRRYSTVAEHLSQMRPGASFSARDVADALPQVFRPDVELALRDMVDHGVLSLSDDGFRWDGDRESLSVYGNACDWRLPMTPIGGQRAVALSAIVA